MGEEDKRPSELYVLQIVLKEMMIYFFPPISFLLSSEVSIFPPRPMSLVANGQAFAGSNQQLSKSNCWYEELWKGREVVCGQVWWPILGICPLHLTHPSAHSQQWTHTWSSGQPYCSARGAVGGSVPCSRVSPQSWYWRWREHLLFTPPTDNPCRTWESNRQPLGYKSNSLTIRPRLPLERQWWQEMMEQKNGYKR